MKGLKLSVIDIDWPGYLGQLVPHLDQLGYHRFWTTEHHGPRQSSSPAVVTAFAAANSKRLRVGAAGAMLNLYSPVRITEDFRVLECLFPGRIDLGVVPATPGVALVQAIMERPELDKSQYAQKLSELMRLIAYESGGGGAIEGRQLGPTSESITPVWVCGVSARTAQMAGKLGAAFAFHHTFNQLSATPENGPDVIKTYLDAFQSTPQRRQPEFNIACYGNCADSSELAREQWRKETSQGGRTAEPAFLGAPDEVDEQLSELAHEYQSEELVISCFSSDFKSKLRAYSSIAKVCIEEKQDLVVNT